MTSASQFVDDVVNVHDLMGRPPECSLIDWLKAQRGRDEDEVRLEMIALPQWTSLYARDGLISAGEKYAGAKRREVQMIHANCLIERNNRKLAPFVGNLVAQRAELFDVDVAALLTAWAE